MFDDILLSCIFFGYSAASIGFLVVSDIFDDREPVDYI